MKNLIFVGAIGLAVFAAGVQPAGADEDRGGRRGGIGSRDHGSVGRSSSGPSIRSDSSPRSFSRSFQLSNTQRFAPSQRSLQVAPTQPSVNLNQGLHRGWTRRFETPAAPHVAEPRILRTPLTQGPQYGTTDPGTVGRLRRWQPGGRAVLNPGTNGPSNSASTPALGFRRGTWTSPNVDNPGGGTSGTILRSGRLAQGRSASALTRSGEVSGLRRSVFGNGVVGTRRSIGDTQIGGTQIGGDTRIVSGTRTTIGTRRTGSVGVRSGSDPYAYSHGGGHREGRVFYRHNHDGHYYDDHHYFGGHHHYGDRWWWHVGFWWDPWYYDVYSPFWYYGVPTFGYGVVYYNTPVYVPGPTVIVEQPVYVAPTQPGVVQPGAVAPAPAPAQEPQAAEDPAVAKARAEFQAALEPFLAGKYEDALGRFRAITTADPKNGEAWLGRAHAAFALGLYGESAHAVGQAAALGAFPRGYRFDPKPIYPAKGSFEGHLARLESWSNEHPDDCDALIVRAWLYMSMDRKADARAALAGIEAIRPEDATATFIRVAMLPPEEPPADAGAPGAPGAPGQLPPPAPEEGVPPPPPPPAPEPEPGIR